MTKMDKRAEDREALERLLEIYGADRTRWPARERLRFAGIVGDDKVGGAACWRKLARSTGCWSRRRVQAAPTSTR